MLPLICAMIVAGLWLAKRYNLGALGARAGNARSVARLTETVVLSPGIRLAVVDFADKRLLLAVTKQGANLLSETRSEEHTSELQSLMRISYAVFCLKKKKKIQHTHSNTPRPNNKSYRPKAQKITNSDTLII